MNIYKFHVLPPYRICPLGGAHADHQYGLVSGFAFYKGVDLWFNPTEERSVELKSFDSYEEAKKLFG